MNERSAMGERSNADKLTPKIFKLNVDCFEHLFEWFSLNDLLTFRETCNRMKQVVDYYIKLYYPKVHKLRIDIVKLAKLHQLKTNDFPWIKHICFDSLKLNQSNIDDIKPLLHRIESIRLNNIKIDGDFYENFLTFCPNLRYLSIKSETLDRIIGNGNEWLDRQLPTPKLHTFVLQRIGISFGHKPINLRKFFELNKNIRNFSTTSRFCHHNDNWMLGSNLHFDRFSVTLNWDVELHSIFDKLKTLHEQKFFKKLHLFCMFNLHGADSLPALEMLHFDMLWTEDDRFPLLEKLRILSINVMGNSWDNTFDSMENKLPNLRRLYIEDGDPSFVRPFIRYAANLEEIILEHFESDEEGQSIKVDDFVALDNERKQLVGASKITIYLDEDLFLNLKWTKTTKFSLIELKRTESFQKDYVFWD